MFFSNAIPRYVAACLHYLFLMLLLGCNNAEAYGTALNSGELQNNH
jgi:hypothetical protein